MPLADMRTLVYQNLIDLFLGMAVGMQKYQPEKKKKDRPVYSTDVHVRYGSKSLPTAVPVTRCCSTVLKNGTIRQLHRSNKDKKYRKVTNHANLFGEHCRGLLSFQAKWLNTFV